MKLITVALFAATAYAGFIQQLPKCVRGCARDGLKKVGCKKNDLDCACANIQTIREDEPDCAIKACGFEVAINEVDPAIEKICNKQ